MFSLIVLKSVFMLFNVSEQNESIDAKLNGNTPPQYDKALHLANYVGACTNKANISKAFGDFVYRLSVLSTAY